jgi:hypothetical protein
MTPKEIEDLKAQIKAEIIEDILKKMKVEVWSNKDVIEVGLIYGDEVFSQWTDYHDFINR